MEEGANGACNIFIAKQYKPEPKDPTKQPFVLRGADLGRERLQGDVDALDVTPGADLWALALAIDRNGPEAKRRFMLEKFCKEKEGATKGFAQLTGGAAGAGAAAAAAPTGTSAPVSRRAWLRELKQTGKNFDCQEPLSQVHRRLDGAWASPALFTEPKPKRPANFWCRRFGRDDAPEAATAGPSRSCPPGAGAGAGKRGVKKKQVDVAGERNRNPSLPQSEAEAYEELRMLYGAVPPPSSRRTVSIKDRDHQESANGPERRRSTAKEGSHDHREESPTAKEGPPNNDAVACKSCDAAGSLCLCRTGRMALRVLQAERSALEEYVGLQQLALQEAQDSLQTKVAEYEGALAPG